MYGGFGQVVILYAYALRTETNRAKEGGRERAHLMSDEGLTCGWPARVRARSVLGAGAARCGIGGGIAA